MKFSLVLTALSALACPALSAPAYLEEFGSGWESRWVKTGSEKFTGVMDVTAGEHAGDAADQAGLHTTANARHYGYTSNLATPFTATGKDLVVQFTVRHTQKLDCGGGYVKLLGADVDQAKFDGDTPYSVMFGPDMCGPSNRKVHLIFNYKGKNLLWKKKPACKTDQLTHLYTMHLKPDGTYRVLIDQDEVESGTLEEDWDFLEPREIADPEAKQPADWVTESMIADPEDSKPEDWDSEPEYIEDEAAKEPEDWDEEEDGKWERPKVRNPKHKGEWKPKMIPNPAYKGPWEAPKIANPAFVADDNLADRGTIGAVGFDLWQVTAGSIFDNILVSDSYDDAVSHADAHWKKHKDAEKAAFDAAEDAKRKEQEEERKRKEEERKAKEEEEKAKKGDDEDDDDEDKEEDDEENKEGGEKEEL